METPRSRNRINFIGGLGAGVFEWKDQVRRRGGKVEGGNVGKGS